MSTPAQHEVRRAMRVTSDPRAARTREAIIAAVHALVAEGDGAPGVSEIARRAGVSRSSFYTQFANLDELTSAVFADALGTIIDLGEAVYRAGVLTRGEAIEEATTRLVAHVEEHRGFYQLGQGASMAAFDEAVRTIAARVREETVAPPAGVGVEVATTYFAGGMLALLRAWVTGDLVCSAEELTAQIVALRFAWMSVDPTTPTPVPPEPAPPRSSRPTAVNTERE